MAYNSIHPGPAIDAAVSRLNEIGEIRDESNANLAAVEQTAQQVSSNAQAAVQAKNEVEDARVQVQTAQALTDQRAADAQGSATTAEQARAATIAAKHETLQARDVAAADAERAEFAALSAGAALDETVTNRAAVQQMAEQVSTNSEAAVTARGEAEQARIDAQAAAVTAATKAAQAETAQQATLESREDSLDAAERAETAASHAQQIAVGDFIDDEAPSSGMVYSSARVQEGFDAFGNTAAPDKGAASIGRAAVTVPTLADLSAVPRNRSLTAVVTAYHPGWAATATGPKGGGQFYWDAASTRPANGGTIIAVPGVSTGRWLRIYEGRLNVKWFGAKGDGTSDDTTAIQAAFDATSALGSVGLDWPAGTYVISSRLSLRDNLHIHATGGATLTASDAYPSSISELMYGGTRTNIRISGLTFNTTTGQSTGHAWISACADVTFTDCKFLSDWNRATALRSGVHVTGGANIRIEKCLFDGIARPIWVHDSGEKIYIQDNVLRNMQSYGINFLDGAKFWKGIRIIGNYINGVGSRHNLIFIGAPSNSDLSGYHDDVIVADNYGEGADRAWPVPDPVTGEDGNGDLFSLRAMNNARVYGNYAINSGDLGLVIEYSKNVTVSNNVVARADISGLVVHNSYNVTVVNNVCYDNALDRAKRFNITRNIGGIKIMAGARDVVVVGNRCYDTRANSAERTQLYGLVITTQKQSAATEPDTGRIVVGTNMFYDNKVGGIYSDVTTLQPSLEFELAYSALLPTQMWPKNTVVRHTNPTAGAPLLSIATRSGYYTTTAAADAGATELVLDDVSFLNANTRLVIQFFNGGTLLNQVASVSVANSTVTLATPLAQNVLSGAIVFFTVWRTAVNYA